MVRRGKQPDFGWTRFFDHHLGCGQGEAPHSVGESTNGRFEHHSNFVKSVLSDPFGQYVASFSHDRSLRLYEVQKFKTSKLAKMSKVISKLVFRPKQCKAPREQSCESNKSNSNEEGINLISENKNIQNQITKDNQPKLETPSKVPLKTQHMFVDSNKQEGLFQRGHWSPCGWFFLAPSGQFNAEGSDKKQLIFGSYMFSRTDFQVPLMFYPTDAQVVLARFSPVLYHRDHADLASNVKTVEDGPDRIVEEKPEIKSSLDNVLNGNSPVTENGAEIIESNKNESRSPFDLPYNLSFILATYSSVMVYSTKSVSPLFRLENIHYAGLSDITWHHSGFHFCVSSLDGFITFGSLKSADLGSGISGNELWNDSNVLNNNFAKRRDYLMNQKNHKQAIHSQSKFVISQKVTFTRREKQ